MALVGTTTRDEAGLVGFQFHGIQERLLFAADRFFANRSFRALEPLEEPLAWVHLSTKEFLGHL